MSKKDRTGAALGIAILLLACVAGVLWWARPVITTVSGQISAGDVAEISRVVQASMDPAVGPKRSGTTFETLNLSVSNLFDRANGLAMSRTHVDIEVQLDGSWPPAYSLAARHAVAVRGIV